MTTDPEDPETRSASQPDADGAAYDAYLDALEVGRAVDVDSFLRDFPGTSPDLRSRLIRLSRRFGRGRERPTDIGGLQILGVLGSGGMGEVFEARDDALERIVAVKVLTPAFAADPSRIARFEREARILAALDHPNVATIHALGRSAGVPPHIVMERVEGTDVARALEGGAMGWRDALDVCEQIARALAAAHERGIVHRDLKPSNVMLRSDGVVKVLDFGLAERLDQRSRDGARPGQHVVGTPGYMSPEQARGEPADERSDVWSFGCILYECLTGSRLGGRGLAGRAGGGERAWSDEVPPPLTKLVERCLALDAAERPRDGAALVGAIQALRVGVSPQRGTLPPLPLRRTRFIGREAERRLVSDAVESGVLVTLVGPGGAGKSRLALEVAGEKVPVAWAELASGGAADVAPSLLKAIGDPPGVADDPLDDVRAGFAAHESLLVVVDNCEHVLASAADAIAAILASAPGVRVLATSREPLGLQDERVVRVEPLSVPEATPETAEGVLACDAVALFVERALAAGSPPLTGPTGAVTDELAAAAELCRRLDGLPLAIELAAARAASIGTEQLARRLDDRHALLRSDTRDGLAHHRSISALVDWSHDLLSGSERILLRRLSVFAGGWTLASAEAVAAAPGLDGLEREDVLVTLSRLTSRSMVTRDAATAGRWRFLETLRDYARGRLETRPERDAVLDAHATRFLDLAERATEESFGDGRLAAFLELESELADLRVAAAYALTRPGLAPRAYALAGGLVEFWISRGLFREGQRMIEDAFASGAEVDDSARAFLHLSYGTVLHRRGRYEEARATFDTSLEIALETGDRSAESRARRNIGFLVLHQRELEEARTWFEAALAIDRPMGDPRRIANLLNDLGVLAVYQARYADAVEFYTESLAMRRASRDAWGIAGSLGNLGEANHRLGDFEIARGQLAESLAGFRDVGDLRSAAESFEMSAALEVSVGDLERATRLSGAAEGLRERFGFPIPTVEAGPYAEDVRQMREGLGDARYDALRLEGKALSIDAALNLALGKD
ncbi:MAG: protein kinase [Planctomycetota bacterium]